MGRDLKVNSQLLAQDRLSSIGLVADGIAHEIGTPLGVIRGRAEFLSRSSHDPQLINNLNVIMAQVDRISRTMSALLRLTQPCERAEKTAVPIPLLLDEVMHLLSPQLQRLRIEIEKPDFEFDVPGHHQQISQVLFNIVHNAIQAIEDQSLLDSNNPRRIRIEFVEIGHERIVRIADSGCGISEAVRQNLFRPFFTTKDVGRGTGLGLATAAKLMCEMRGDIRISSEVGGGTVVDLAFPSLT